MSLRKLIITECKWVQPKNLWHPKNIILGGLRGDQYQVVQKCSSMSYISLTPQKFFFDFLLEEVT